MSAGGPCREFQISEKGKNHMSFVTMLTAIRDGALITNLTDALKEVTQAVTQTGKEGKVDLTIEIKPNGEGVVTVKSKVKVTKPRPGVGDALFFFDEDGGLHRRDPRQMEMGLGDDLAARRAAKTKDEEN
jgi:hypothetical protein